MLLGSGGVLFWLEEWLRLGFEVCGGGGRIGMLEEGGVGVNIGDELFGVFNLVRLMRVFWLLEWLFFGWG